MSKSNRILFAFAVVFLAWVAVSGIFNSDTIQSASLRGRSGTSRFVSSAMVLAYCFALAVVVSRCTWHQAMTYILRPAMYGTFFAAAVGALEVAYWLAPGTGGIYAAAVALLRPGFPHLTFWGRMTSVAFEPHGLGLWLSFVTPISVWGWAFYARGPKARLWWGAALAANLAMLALSQARASLVVAAGVFLVLVVLKLTQWSGIRRAPYRALLIANLLGLFAILAVQFVGQDEIGQIFLQDGKVSNLSRFAMNVSTLQQFADSPVVGKGLGQFAFWATDFMPQWGWYSGEIQAWLIEAERGWPSTFSLPGRILSELGLVGFGLWHAYVFAIMWAALSRPRVVRVGGKEYDIRLLLVLLVPYVFFTTLPNETFAQMGFWLAIGLATASLSMTGPGRSAQ
ncbi:O-antigen ligase family protein [Pelagibacterium halotolerans]|uniref:O-antigen ligase family protein n=1 Tax=Pelagibacterium halotolerans TaxID=531813 RepID=UPI003850121F